MYKEMCKRTGTEVEFIHPAAGSTGTEAFQILLSSGDYPDMIEYAWANYAGGPDQAINDGVIIALNDYLEDYAPNYYYCMDGEGGKENGYLYKAAAISNAGKANLQAGISNIILGKASFDTYDDVIKAAKDAGYEKLIKINQAAYDRYAKVIKNYK